MKAVLLILAVLPLRAADPEAAALLAKSVTAFEANFAKEKNWNWTTSEKRQLADRSSRPVQTFPDVRSESVIMNNGRRCNAVTFWGDGHQPFPKDASPEERCLTYSALTVPFSISMLLKGANVKIVSRAHDAVTVSVAPDKVRQRDPDYAVKCAASIEATVRLDAATGFPLRIEGRVADAGCNFNFVPAMHDTPIDRGPMASNFRKGSTFRVVWTLEKDRFENLANSFWMITEQHYDQPVSDEMTVLYYWGRQFRVRTSRAYRLIKDVTATAQEFGVGSQITFK